MKISRGAPATPQAVLVTRRALLTTLAGLLGFAGFGACGLSTPSPVSPPGGSVAGGSHPRPTDTVGATPRATSEPVTSPPTLTPRPTETPTPIPSPTVTPTEALPTPTKEALRYNGTLSFEAKAWSDNLPFKELVLNPKYPNAQEALKRLILTIHTWGEAASPKPGQVPDQQKLLKMDPYILEKRMLQENITYKIPGHYSDKWDEDNSPGLVEIDPSQGVNFGYIVNKNMLYQPPENRYKGNAIAQKTLQFRYISDIKTHKLTIMAITDPSAFEDPPNIEYIQRMKGLFFDYWMEYSIDAMRYPDRLYGTNIGEIPLEEYSKDVLYILGKPAPKDSQVDGKYIVIGYNWKNDPSNNKRYPLLIYG